jgi:ATP-binding cassette subfamily B (MDR/TAP) protein 1
MALAPDHEKSIRAIDSILNVVNRVPEMDARSGRGVDAASVEGAVSFKDVSFRYRTRKDVLALRDFNLRVKPGMTVGLVGSSGSGKSTVGVVAFMYVHYSPCE